jgi:hypothetical protein
MIRCAIIQDDGFILIDDSYRTYYIRREAGGWYIISPNRNQTFSVTDEPPIHHESGYTGRGISVNKDGVSLSGSPEETAFAQDALRFLGKMGVGANRQFHPDRQPTIAS